MGDRDPDKCLDIHQRNERDPIGAALSRGRGSFNGRGEWEIETLIDASVLINTMKNGLS